MASKKSKKIKGLTLQFIPYSEIVGLDSVERIARSFKFKKVAEPVLVKNKPDVEACKLLEETTKKFLTFF